jgi:muconolactone delta-isomerase
VLYYAKLTERTCVDAQEARQMALIRRKSLSWLKEQMEKENFDFAFRSEDNDVTHIFLDAPDHVSLHDLLDPDPLISYCYVDIEPLLKPVESAKALEIYLSIRVLSNIDWNELAFENRSSVEPDGVYYLARKTIKPFSPLLSLADQDRIHKNTLISQTAHADMREIVDYNPVGKPVGILVMKANSAEEVYDHVSNCEVYVDSNVEITRLLTLDQATISNEGILSKYLIGEFNKVAE